MESSNDNGWMLERAAVAMSQRLYEIEAAEGESGPDYYRRLGMGEYQTLLRAALVSLREVSPPVEAAGADWEYGYSEEERMGNARCTFRMMLDAILAPREAPQ